MLSKKLMITLLKNELRSKQIIYRHNRIDLLEKDETPNMGRIIFGSLFLDKKYDIDWLQNYYDTLAEKVKKREYASEDADLNQLASDIYNRFERLANDAA